MRHLVATTALVLIASGIGLADYVELSDWGPVGDSDYEFHYKYYRETFEPDDPAFLDTGGTWTLTYMLDNAYLISGASYWDSGTIFNDGTAAIWTYNGNDLPGPDSVYGTFDLKVTNAHGNIDWVTYTVDFDGDGTDDFSGQVLAPLPEPGTFALASLGLAAIAVRLRRRRD
ncbi:MAG: PEP-CTERM sorting domain-containing protein, partial [Armatimonadota bacterium]|nr:PEP-CTERM sorting domain-containing protein [Armatimonadota bacterium]